MSHSSFLILLEKNPHIEFVDLIIVTLSGREWKISCSVADVEAVIRQGREIFLDVFFDVPPYRSPKGDENNGCGLPVALIRIPFEKPLNQDGVQNNRAEVLLSMYERPNSASSPKPYLGDPRHALKNIVDKYHQQNQSLFVEIGFSFIIQTNTKDKSIQHEDNETLHLYMSEVERICGRQQIPLATRLVNDNSRILVKLKASNNVLQVADYLVIVKHILNQVAKTYGLITDIFQRHHFAENNEIDSERTSKIILGLSIFDQQGDNLFNSNHANCQTTFALNGLKKYSVESGLFFSPDAKYKSQEFQKKESKNNEKQYEIKAHYDLENSLQTLYIEGENAQIQHRLADVQSNPYLVIGAILASSFIGMQDKLKRINAQCNEGLNHSICPEINEVLLTESFLKSTEFEAYFGAHLKDNVLSNARKNATKLNIPWSDIN